MGLTISYTLSTRRRLDLAGARKLVEQLRAAAVKTGAPEVGELFPVGPDFTWAYHHPPSAQTYRDLLPPLEGWLFMVDPGDGCESVRLGLCRYRGVPGWRLRAFCKTQYAMRHGWEHFRACHRRVVDVLRACEQEGLTVKVDDEGGYWTSGSEWVLFRKIGEYDRMIAGMAGALKDSIGDPGIKAPITEDPCFERLEAEGRQGNEQWLAGAVETVKKVLRRPPASPLPKRKRGAEVAPIAVTPRRRMKKGPVRARRTGQ